MPSVWRSARKKKKRKHRDPQPGTPPPEGESSEQSLDKKSGWIYEYAPPPPPEQCLSDDEVSAEVSWGGFILHIYIFLSAYTVLLTVIFLDNNDGADRIKVLTNMR